MKTKFLAAGFALLALGAWAAVHRTPRPSEFCDQCVMQRDVVEWRLAGRWTLFETARDTDTPVSVLLREHHVSQAHAHHWSAPRYVADADLETAEAPRERSIGMLNQPRTMSFLRCVFEYSDAAEIARWREMAWQPTYAAALEPALRFNRFPEEGFATRGEFYKWWDERSFPLFNRLHDVTVAD